MQPTYPGCTQVYPLSNPNHENKVIPTQTTKKLHLQMECVCEWTNSAPLKGVHLLQVGKYHVPFSLEICGDMLIREHRMIGLH